MFKAMLKVPYSSLTTDSMLLAYTEVIITNVIHFHLLTLWVHCKNTTFRREVVASKHTGDSLSLA